MIEILTLFAIYIASALSGGSQTTVVLLPEEDGKVGAVSVSNDGGAQLINQAYNAVDASGGATPTPPRSFDAGEVQRVLGAALAVEPQKPRPFLLYFQSGTATMLPESLALLPDILAEIGRRPAADISVIGHSDTVGAEDANVRLSLRRAEAVRDRLTAAGFDARNILLRSHGERDLIVPTPDNVAESRNRRVEVTVR